MGALPPDGANRHTVHRVTTSQTQQFVIFSRSIFGQYIHWYGGRSHQCTKDKSACNGCYRGWPTKWLGYFDALNMHSDERVFVEITATAFKLLDTQIPPGENCRGLQVRICKTKGGPKGRYKVEVLDSAWTLPRCRKRRIRSTRCCFCGNAKTGVVKNCRKRYTHRQWL